MKQIIYLIFPAVFLFSCNNSPNKAVVVKSADDVPQIFFTTAERLPHDTTSFTEGFLFHNNQLFESTGSPSEMEDTRSLFGIVDLKTGKIDKKAELDRNKYFGEGIVFIKDKIYQLTYKKQTCFVYDANTYRNIGKYSYSNKEGWGLTTDGTYIIMSDGTNVLSYYDPADFHLVKTLQVTANNFAVDNLNELEYIKGFIYANIWSTDKIVKIDPATGHVTGKMDLSILKDKALERNPESLDTNGIAYDSATNKIYVTGKMWPYIFQINLRP